MIEGCCFGSPCSSRTPAAVHAKEAPRALSFLFFVPRLATAAAAVGPPSPDRLPDTPASPAADAENCIDRHVQAGRGEQTALIWEADEPGEGYKVTFSELQAQVDRLANVLKSRGVKKVRPVRL